jgi:nitroimidazol reductase NimA-like FMN-containing flavoprotein (pyridoxamine 5'-phosphate oxidase superfamily)
MLDVNRVVEERTTVSEAGNPLIDMVLEEVDREACLALLRTQSVGRLAVADHGYYPPHIVPVNFELDGDAVVFRSDDGLKFRLSVLAEHSVSFEVDWIDPAGRLAWSVVVQGRAQLLTAEEIEQLPYGRWLQPWAPGERTSWVRIVPYAITGRRLHPAPRRPGAAVQS